MKTALVTGANKGIGLETTRQLLQEGFYVYLGSRDLQNGLKAVDDLKSMGLTNVEVVELDVTEESSVKAAREAIGRKTSIF
ncbi:SDR family NAD(P)-dependent oxidoreductase [Spirosoma endophyticum]|uniref:SDR family NAD(P)-dependent oxidoreductase n=1 Tax=Spirosoma endophyticum TaxID=662367 RepID=UPI000B84C5EF|nr:SDR family NAD(P)-dependent oxidoreductase [Spirosoma endophyticum]